MNVPASSDQIATPEPVAPGFGGLDDLTVGNYYTSPAHLSQEEMKYCSGTGQYHSPNNKVDPRHYLTVTRAEIEAMAKNPPDVPKAQARWMIPSSELSRVHGVQRDHGIFYAAWLDIDDNPLGFKHVVEAGRSILSGCGFIAYTTKSATPENQKCRVLIFYAVPCPGETHIIVEKILNDRLEASGIAPDRKSELAGQICYLPNRGEFYRYHIEDGSPLDWQTFFANEIEAEKQRIHASKIALEKRRKESSRKLAERLATGKISVIQAYNEAHDIEDVMALYGYRQIGDRYLSPNSSSGSPGVSVKEGRWVSSHESDRMSIGVSGDAFELYMFYEHNGNRDAALKAIADTHTTEDGRTISEENRQRYLDSLKNENVTDKTSRYLFVTDSCIGKLPESHDCYPVTDSTPPACEEEKEHSFDETIAELGRLSPIEYDRRRKDEADKLGVRAATLDQAVREVRKKDGNDSDLPFNEIEPWPSKIDPAELLSAIESVVKRFIATQPVVAVAVALWITMTWFLDVIAVCPLAIITAPEKRCGKTQLLTLIGKMVCRAITASSISPSALFRAIDAWKPTLLIDETDACLKDNEELRGIINSGHTRDSAYVIRTVGETFTPTKFNTWGPKALSGIGHIADTLMDRAIILELRRKLPHEQVDRLRYAEDGLFEELAAKLARFSLDYSEQVRRSRPKLPHSLNDRAQDNWEPLLAIAEVAGPEWFEKATQAAMSLSMKAEKESAQSIGVELLSDIRDIFKEKHVDRISTADLIEALKDDDEKPWSTYNRGLPIKPRQIANKLREYGVSSKTVRLSSCITAKGFEIEQFRDAFSRYLPSTPSLSVTTSQPNASKGLSVTDSKTYMAIVTDKKQDKIPEFLNCYPVTDSFPPVGRENTIMVKI